LDCRWVVYRRAKPALTVPAAEGALRGGILQVREDLVLAHIAVAHQQNLQQIVVVLGHGSHVAEMGGKSYYCCGKAFKPNISKNIFKVHSS